MANDKVTVAYVHGLEVPMSFRDCMERMIFYDAMNNERIIAGGGRIAMRHGTGGIVQARNQVVDQFLDSDSDFLFWIDTDMGFEADVVDRLLEVADVDEAPIVGGLCFAQKETTQDGYGGYRCKPRVTLLDWIEHPEGGNRMTGRAWYAPNMVTEVASTGSACILIHRRVFEAIREEHGATWYNRILGDDKLPLGEDISFCVRASALGFPILVHTGVRTTHYKNIWLGEQDFWDYQVAPPARTPVGVIVPVLGRPEHADPFMASLRASTGLATAYAVVERGDWGAEAWRASGAVVVDHDGDGPEPHTFAEKVNAAYQRTTEPWVLLVGSDVRFHPGWLDHAQYAAKCSGCAVIGTNDLGNPRVLRGEHATHMMIEREYIDEVGASWDGPKVVCHEGYKHWYVDDEIVTAAKLRSTFVAALASKVEHLHPIWGKGVNDSIYAMGQAHAEDDRKVFDARFHRAQQAFRTTAKEEQ